MDRYATADRPKCQNPNRMAMSVTVAVVLADCDGLAELYAGWRRHNRSECHCDDGGGP